MVGRVTNVGVVHGYTVAIWWAVAIMLVAVVVAATMVTVGAPRHRTPQGERLGPAV